jgi:hypothetical protein
VPAPTQGALAAVPAKPRVVVLGSGWGAISFVRALPAVRRGAADPVPK